MMWRFLWPDLSVRRRAQTDSWPAARQTHATATTSRDGGTGSPFAIYDTENDVTYNPSGFGNDRMAWAVAVEDKGFVPSGNLVGAFVFNLSMMLFIGKLSAVAYSVFAFFKEILLVLVAFLLFSESITRCEIEGYFVTLIAVVVWQHRKLCPPSS